MVARHDTDLDHGYHSCYPCDVSAKSQWNEERDWLAEIKNRKHAKLQGRLTEGRIGRVKGRQMGCGVMRSREEMRTGQ